MKMIKWFILFLLALNLMVVPSTIYGVYYGWDVPSNQLPIEAQIISAATLVLGSICTLLVVIAGTVQARYGKDEHDE